MHPWQCLAARCPLHFAPCTSERPRGLISASLGPAFNLPTQVSLMRARLRILHTSFAIAMSTAEAPFPFCRALLIATLLEEP